MHAGASAADIAEVSERMRRSCGLRQSTVDCEMIGPKRLEPGAAGGGGGGGGASGVENQRRSSMSMMVPR